MPKIVQKDNPVLRVTARPVGLDEIGSPALKKLLKEMRATLAVEPDGIALAAPQLGVSKRIFVVSTKIFGENSVGRKDLVFINPRIVKMAKKKKQVEEGCLSVRWLYGQVVRAEKASVEAFDENGKKFIRHGSGLMAQIFQHEIDHLDGVLFIDKAKNVRELKTET